MSKRCLHACRSLVFAEEAREVCDVMKDLQLTDLPSLLKWLDKHVLVQVGPGACQYWRRDGGEDKSPAPHVGGICWLCDRMAIAGDEL